MNKKILIISIIVLAIFGYSFFLIDFVLQPKVLKLDCKENLSISYDIQSGGGYGLVKTIYPKLLYNNRIVSQTIKQDEFSKLDNYPIDPKIAENIEHYQFVDNFKPSNKAFPLINETDSWIILVNPDQFSSNDYQKIKECLQTNKDKIDKFIPSNTTIGSDNFNIIRLGAIAYTKPVEPTEFTCESGLRIKLFASGTAEITYIYQYGQNSSYKTLGWQLENGKMIINTKMIDEYNWKVAYPNEQYDIIKILSGCINKNNESILEYLN